MKPLVPSRPDDGGRRESAGPDHPPPPSPEAASSESGTGYSDAVAGTRVEQVQEDEHGSGTEQLMSENNPYQTEHADPEQTSSGVTPAQSRGTDRTDGRRLVGPLSGAIDRRPTREDALTMVKHGLIDTITFVAFLAAVALPFLYIPLLVLGEPGAAQQTGFLLIGIHALSLAIGYRYEPRTSISRD